MEMAKPAGAAPKVSSGRVYMLTLNAATAKMPSEIPADAQAGVGAHGRAAVATETTAAARHTRKRAAGAAAPRSTNRRESQPPRKPPAHANTGGIQTYHAACRRVSRYTSTMYLDRKSTRLNSSH